MKKIILGLIVVMMIALVSCNEENNSVEVNKKDDVKEVVNDNIEKKENGYTAEWYWGDAHTLTCRIESNTEDGSYNIKEVEKIVKERIDQPKLLHVIVNDKVLGYVCPTFDELTEQEVKEIGLDPSKRLIIK